MEEDEEVVPENSILHHHLLNAGFCQVETKHVGEAIVHQTAPLKIETIDDHVMEEVLILKAANLLFEDDLNYVDCVFANFQLKKSESLRCMFRGTTSVFVLALGLCFYVYLGSYAFVLVSIFYAYRTSDYLWKKHRRLKQLKRLIAAVKSNFSLLNKIIKFVHESEGLLKTKLSPSHGTKALDRLSTLKDDFIELQAEVNCVFANATCKLLKDVPLCEYVEIPNGYICQKMDEFRDMNKVSQLYNIYMLLQSQFLTRLILSLVPNLMNSPEKSYNALNEVITRLTVRLREIQSTLSRKFKFAFLNGILFESGKAARPLPQKERNKDCSVVALVNNIHDLSNSLQFSLIKARELESCIESGDLVDPQKELSAIQNELKSCQNHIMEILIMHNKYHTKKLTKNSIQEKTGLNITETESIPVTEIGYPNLDPEVDDDIFEAIIDDMPATRETLDWEQEEVDLLAKKKQKEMLGELKTRLKQQAEDWARRESMVLARKGLPPLPPPQADEVTDSSSGESSVEDIRSKVRRGRQTQPEAYRDSSSDEECRSARNALPSIGGASLLAQALQQARGNLMSSTLEEESFCCSGENSDIED